MSAGDPTFDEHVLADQNARMARFIGANVQYLPEDQLNVALEMLADFKAELDVLGVPIVD